MSFHYKEWKAFDSNIDVWLAEDKDLEAVNKDLLTRINAMESQISVLDTEVTSNSKISDEKVTKLKEQIQTLKNEIVSALQDGEWKKTFTGEIADSLQAIEKRYKEINAALDAKMVKLVEAGAIEEKVVAIFLAQESKIREIIQQEGKKVKSDLDDKLRNADILDMIRKESQTITWES